MKSIFRNCIAIIVLVGVVYYVTNYSAVVQEQIGVKGASTSRAKEIAGQLSNDVGTQVNSAEKQLLQMKVSDIINGLSRFQRVPQDVNNIKNYVQTQANSVLESKYK
jgi:TolA-binding protein